MKTLIIYIDFENDPRFVMVDGDFSRFNGVHVNSVSGTGFEEEFCNWFFNNQTGDFNHELSYDTSLLENKEWDKIAITTFLP